jgi:bifunctional non-homologous end joining protein LigD
VFEKLRRSRTSTAAVLCAFDLIELDGGDLRGLPIEKRKRFLAKLIRGAHSSIALNQHFDAEGGLVFDAACRLGCEGIVSKRLGSKYRSGRSDSWVKIKNPEAPAVRREAEEDWGR